ncbi:MAG: hypothetical protein ACFCVK_02890 [Acidimicrobiales bacterium]
MTGPADDRPPPVPGIGSEPDDGSTGRQAIALALFEHRLHQLGARETARIGWRNLWLAHHWPADYGPRCVHIGSRPVCRRCAALYPLGFLVAVVSAAGYAPWPPSLDPWPIWLLSIPATVAYVGEALGWFRYDARWQVATTLVAAVAFGRGLGYELLARWSPEFWGPIVVFGTLWLSATLLADRGTGGRGSDAGQRAATASTSSSSVL